MLFIFVFEKPEGKKTHKRKRSCRGDTRIQLVERTNNISDDGEGWGNETV